MKLVFPLAAVIALAACGPKPDDDFVQKAQAAAASQPVPRPPFAIPSMATGTPGDLQAEPLIRRLNELTLDREAKRWQSQRCEIANRIAGTYLTVGELHSGWTEMAHDICVATP